MKLYHGTSAKYLARVLREGLKPRGTKPGVWADTSPSRPDAVYLTAAYPLHYALAAAGHTHDRVVFEVDTAKLNPFRFVPDEDCLEQATRGNRPEGCPEDVAGATLWIRDRLHNHAATETWQLSLKHLGNCAYLGSIPPDAITRYAVIPKSWPVLRWSDPTITLANFRFMGPYYRKLSALIFGERGEPDPEERHGLYRLPAPEDLAPICVSVCNIS